MRRVLGLLVAVLALVACRRDASPLHDDEGLLKPEPTALDQSSTKSDLELVADIRRRLIDDRELSFSAKTVTVIVRDGVVTLRGHVRDDADHVALIKKVVSVPNVVRLDDRVTSS